MALNLKVLSQRISQSSGVSSSKAVAWVPMVAVTARASSDLFMEVPSAVVIFMTALTLWGVGEPCKAAKGHP
jgi:hypothetical protein